MWPTSVVTARDHSLRTVIFTVRNSSYGKGNVFTSVCHSVHRVVVYTPQAAPLADTPPPMATAANGTHPTRMHSCFGYVLSACPLWGGGGGTRASSVPVQTCSLGDPTQRHISKRMVGLLAFS